MNKLKIALGVFVVIFCLVLLFILLCSPNIYEKKLDKNHSFSFEYLKRDHLYPASLLFPRFYDPAPPQIKKFENEALISVQLFPFQDQGVSHIDIFCSSMKDFKYIHYFEVIEKGTVLIDSQRAEYVKYAYDA
jgi:hypothetical protein